MYLNLKQFQKSNLTPEQLIQLIAIKQKEVDLIKEEFLERFEELEYVRYIKGKKSARKTDLVRLSPSGEKLLKKLEEAEVTEDDEKVFEYLKNRYLREGKEIGNGAKTKRHIRDFRIKSGIERNNLLRLVLDFLNENEEKSNKLEYIWYYPKTIYDTKFCLDESWVWNHYLKNEERLKATFEEY